MTFSVTQTVIPSRTAGDLYAALLAGNPPFILDVRNEEEFARSRIEGRQPLDILHIPYFEFLEAEEESIARVPFDREVVVVCAKGGSSEYVAEILQGRGIQAANLEDGMIGWGNYYDVRDIVNAPYGRVVQIARPARGDLSFVIISDGQAALIDPLRHTAPYLDVVAGAGATITHLFDTHAHADHISGGPALARQTGATYYLHPYDGIHPIDMLPARISYTPLADGQRYGVGQFAVEVVWFPGHTLGQVNFLFHAPSGERFLYTGDGIFLRSFGRPDLGGQGEAWTPILYESLFERLPRHVTDDTLILPAHFSSLAEGDDNGVFAAPYSQVRRQNDALRPRTREEFIAYVLSNLPVFPPEYVEIKRVNAGLVEVCEGKASELELGKNICALSNS